MGLPVVLVGDTRSRALVTRLRELGWGRMCVRDTPAPFPGEPWGFDNGAFGCWRRGEEFDGFSFCDRLRAARATGMRPLVAVTPDIVAAGVDSLDFSLRWLPQLPGDWPWYLAVQDGMTTADVRPVAGRFAGICLGGTTPWKHATAQQWADFAHGEGLPMHFARAGTIRTLRLAKRVGADSLDSAFPLWTRARFETFARFWARDPEQEMALAGVVRP